MDVPAVCDAGGTTALCNDKDGWAARRFTFIYGWAMLGAVAV